MERCRRMYINDRKINNTQKRRKGKKNFATGSTKENMKNSYERLPF
jgi:hypothetical protein